MKGTGGDPGWYFVLQERPGEARFGLELSRTAPIETFDDVTWEDAMPGVTARPVPVRLGAWPTSRSPSRPTSPIPTSMTSGATTRRLTPPHVSSARWAYVLFRQPVMVAVHADEMLAENGPSHGRLHFHANPVSRCPRGTGCGATRRSAGNGAGAVQAQSALDLATRQNNCRRR